MSNKYMLDFMNSVSSTMQFIGTKELLPRKGKIGEIYICNGIEYVWADKWQEIGNVQQESYTQIDSPKKMKPWICERCGAPMRNSKCGYCDTQYF